MMNKQFHWILVLCLSIPLLATCQEPEYGYAVYYADYLHGQPTASGEIYDKNKYTCAHRTHPFGTLLRVTRLDNNRFVTVRVNDRGPMKEERVVDVSRAAAEQLDLIKAGKAQVSVEVIGFRELPQSTVSRSVEPAPDAYGLYERSGGHSATLPPSKPKKKKRSKKKAQEVIEDYNQPEEELWSINEYPSSYEQKATRLSSSNRVEPAFTERGTTATVAEMPAGQTGFAIQLASFSVYDNAVRQVNEWKNKGMDHVYLKRSSSNSGGTLYKVVVGPFNYRQNAEDHLENLRSSFALSGLVITL